MIYAAVGWGLQAPHMGTRLGRLAISACPEWSNFDEISDRLDRILMPLVLRAHICYKKAGIVG
jgi:hypothetical protein